MFALGGKIKREMYITTVHPDTEHKVSEIDVPTAYKVIMPEEYSGIYLFIHRPLGLDGTFLKEGWTVSEKSTGARITGNYQGTRQDAIDSLSAMLDKVSPEAFQDKLDALTEKYGEINF